MLSINAPLAKRIRYELHTVTADELLQYIDDHESMVATLESNEVDPDNIEEEFLIRSQQYAALEAERDKLREAIDAVIQRLGEIE